MEITEKKLEEALLDMFRTGQKAYQAPSYPMRYHVAEKVQELKNENT